MSQFYKILTASPMGEPWTNPNVQGAKPVLSYWCQVEGEELSVMIGKQVRDDGQPALYPGQHVYGDLMKAVSQKGTNYWKFKSAQVPEGVQRPQDGVAPQTPASQPSVSPDTKAQFDALEDKINEINQMVGLLDTNIDSMMDMLNDIHKVVYMGEKPIPTGLFDGTNPDDVPFVEPPANVVKTFGE